MISNNNNTVWIVDDDKSIRWVLEKAFTNEQIQAVSFDNAEKALSRLDSAAPDVIISDIRMPGSDGIALLEKIKKRAPEIPVIIMTAYSDLSRAVSAFQSGAFEYLPKPFDVDEVISLVRRAIKQKQIKQAIPRTRDELPPDTNIIGSAPAMQEVFRAIGRLSSSNLTVLITGESGTGKELIAAVQLQSDGPDYR